MFKRIQPGSKVVFNYRVIAGQEVVDSSSRPATIEIGRGQFFPVVEEALLGHEAGERLVVLVPPEKHYGPYDPKKIHFIPTERLPREISPGQVVRVPDDFGVPHPAIVRRVDPEVALVDFNHPLAGKPLRFEIEILEVIPPEDAPEERQKPPKEEANPKTLPAEENPSG